MKSYENGIPYDRNDSISPNGVGTRFKRNSLTLCL